MKKSISEHDFIREFSLHSWQDNFSRGGLRALFCWLEELGDVELDVVALCCEFSEYESAFACADGVYAFYYDLDLDEDEQEAAALEYLQGRTQLLEFDGGIIIRDF